VHAALGRGDGDVEDGGDVFVRPALDVAQNERRAGLEREGTDLAHEPGHVLALAGGNVGRQRSRGRRLRAHATLQLGCGLERLRVGPTPPSPLQSLVDGDPVQPGEGRRLAAEAVEVAPGLHERVLRGLLDVARIIEETPEDGSDAPLAHSDELAEGVEVAFLRSPEQRPFRILHREDASKPSSLACDRPPARRIQEFVSILLFALNGSHGETARHMSAYAEGELTGYRRWRVSRHLARCEMCQALYRSLLTTLDSLRTVGREAPPADPDFPGRVIERLRDEDRKDAG
jgi:Putative zinc-finger